jgi:hypothetical protein
LARLIGGEDRADGLALFGGELGAEGRRVDYLLALFCGHGAEIADGSDHEGAAGRRESAHLLHGVAPLLLLLRGEALESLDAIEDAATLFGAHVVECPKLFAVALLRLRRQLVEAGQLLQCALLLSGREILVVLHPLLDVGANAGVVDWSAHGGRRRGAHGGRLCGLGCGARLSALGGSSGGTVLLLRVLLTKAASKGRCSYKHHKKCRAEGEPGWTRRFH